MMKSALVAAVLAAAQAISSQAFARAPAPLIATALVEDVRSASADVEFMDYVGLGQLIKLGPSDVLVLSYLKSCAYETITGGIVRVGADQSAVEGGTVVRSTVPCNGGKMKLNAQEANASGASSFRLQNAAFQQTVYALPPVIQVPKLRSTDSRTLVVERVRRPNERFTLAIDDSLAEGGLYDLAKADAHLQRGARYTVTLGARKFTFRVDSKAKGGNAPVISRLLRFPPS